MSNRLRVAGVGVLRFERGRLWLLSGDGFGVCVDTWEGLFGRFDVRTTEHGQDERGLWWLVAAGPDHPDRPLSPRARHRT